MGGSQSKRDQTFRSNEWQQARDLQQVDHGELDYVVVRNNITRQLLDRYSLQFPNQQQYNRYIESISYRRNQPNIVRVKHFEPKIVKQFCGSSYMLNVYLEHCRSRLSQYEDIPFPDYLYCAMAMLQGYKKLFSKVGRFGVSENQVMIDQEGEVRVWLNSDFSENQPEFLKNQIVENRAHPNDSKLDEYQLVNDVMNMVFLNSDENDGPPIRLVDYYQRQMNTLGNKISFQDAKGIILDYSKENKVVVPDVFKSVLQIYGGVPLNQNMIQIQMHNNLSFQNKSNLDLIQRRQQIVSSGGHGIPIDQFEPLGSGLTSNSNKQLTNPLHSEASQRNVQLPVSSRFAPPQSATVNVPVQQSNVQHYPQNIQQTQLHQSPTIIHGPAQHHSLQQQPVFLARPPNFQVPGSSLSPRADLSQPIHFNGPPQYQQKLPQRIPVNQFQPIQNIQPIHHFPQGQIPVVNQQTIPHPMIQQPIRPAPLNMPQLIQNNQIQMYPQSHPQPQYQPQYQNQQEPIFQRAPQPLTPNIFLQNTSIQQRSGPTSVISNDQFVPPIQIRQQNEIPQFKPMPINQKNETNSLPNNKNKELDREQKQIQRHLIMKQLQDDDQFDRNHVQDINQAKIMKDLHQFHRIQEQQISKRSQDNDNNYQYRNQGYHRQNGHDEHDEHDGYGEYNGHGQQGHHIQNIGDGEDEQDGDGFRGNYEFSGHDGNQQEMEAEDQKYLRNNQNKYEQNKKFQMNGYSGGQTRKMQFNNFSLNDNQRKQSGQQAININYENGDSENVFSQQVQGQGNQYFSGYNGSGQTTNQRNILTNYNGNSRKDLSKASYYTLSDQVDLDPEIAADMLMYGNL